jgi:hypothetical protein
MLSFKEFIDENDLLLDETLLDMFSKNIYKGQTLDLLLEQLNELDKDTKDKADDNDNVTEVDVKFKNTNELSYIFISTTDEVTGQYTVCLLGPSGNYDLSSINTTTDYNKIGTTSSVSDFIAQLNKIELRNSKGKTFKPNNNKNILVKTITNGNNINLSTIKKDKISHRGPNEATSTVGYKFKVITNKGRTSSGATKTIVFE